MLYNQNHDRILTHSIPARQALNLGYHCSGLPPSIRDGDGNRDGDRDKDRDKGVPDRGDQVCCTLLRLVRGP